MFRLRKNNFQLHTISEGLSLEQVFSVTKGEINDLMVIWFIILFLGSWSLQFERGSALVTLRSLLWLGYVTYHVPGTRNFGSIYVGTGEKNNDLPFML